MSITRFVAGAAVACAMVMVSSPRAARADEGISEEARKHFAAGVSLLQDPDGARYEDAYREFEAAYAASSSPKILGNIGYCALKLERDGEAIAAYTRYLKEVPDVDPAEAAQVARDVSTLKAGLVHLMLTFDGADATVVDRRVPVRGEPVSNLYGPANGKIEIGVRPGHHVLEAKVHGEALEPWEFDAQPGASLLHAFVRKPSAETAQPAAAAPSSSKALPWAVMGVGAASLAAGGVFGALTLSKVNAIASNCPGNNCPSTYALKPAQDDVHKFATITDALLIGGGVVTAAGLYLFFFTGGEAPVQHPTTGAAKASLEPPAVGCGATGCLATMRGTF